MIINQICLITGYYIFIEASFPQDQGDIARLTYSNFTGSVCLRFVRNMHGDNIGWLRIKVDGSTVLAKNDSKGDSWLQTATKITGTNVTVSSPICFSKRLSPTKTKIEYIYLMCTRFKSGR